MALHGVIVINMEVLGQWEARRLEPLKTEVDEHTYEWRVEVRPVTKSEVTVASGVLTHRYSDGCIVLTAKVLQAAAEQGVGVRG